MLDIRYGSAIYGMLEDCVNYSAATLNNTPPETNVTHNNYGFF